MEWSFEVFTPRQDLPAFLKEVGSLQERGAAWCSVTWGRSGDSNLGVARAIQDATGLQAVAHVSGEASDARAVAARAQALGLGGVLAVRGDRAAPGCTGEGVAEACRRGAPGLEVLVSGHPQGHACMPCATLEENAAYVSRKLAAACGAGRERVVTQACLDPGAVARFAEAVRLRSPGAEVVAGVYVAPSARALRRMLELSCQPSDSADANRALGELDACGTVAEAEACGVRQAVSLCRAIRSGGSVASVHFYSMNRMDLVRRVVDEVQLAAVQSQA